MYHKILVAIDKSELTQDVFDKGVFLAKITNAEIILLHMISNVENPAISPVFLEPDTVYPSVQTELLEEYFQQW